MCYSSRAVAGWKAKGNSRCTFQNDKKPKVSLDSKISFQTPCPTFVHQPKAMFCVRPCFNSDYKSGSSLLSTDYQQSRARNYNPYNIVSNILFNIHIQRRIHTGDHHGFTTKMSLVFKVISFHSLNFVVLETLSLKKGLKSKKKRQ